MDHSTFSNLLDKHVRPQTFPVAIKMCKDASQIPAKAKRPVRYPIPSYLRYNAKFPSQYQGVLKMITNE